MKPKKKLDHQQKIEILEYLNEGITQTTIAKEFKVSQPYINQLFQTLKEYKLAKERIKAWTKALLENWNIIDKFEDKYGEIE